MKQRQITLAKILTYSGTLPLIASVLSIYFPLAGFDSALIATSYAAIIISFLCGADEDVGIIRKTDKA